MSNKLLIIVSFGLFQNLNSWSAFASSYTDNSSSLVLCLNDHQPKNPVSSLDHLLSNEMTALPVAGAWWSLRGSQNQEKKIPLTLVSQLSFDRLEQLEAQCRSWGGPISAVLYLALDYSSGGRNSKAIAKKMGLKLDINSPEALLESCTELAMHFHARMEREQPCQMDLMMVFEKFDFKEYPLFFPINVLRNYARLQARTPLIALFDVDMLPSSALFEDMQNEGRLKWYLDIVQGSAGNPPAVLVLPAFKTNSFRLGIDKTPMRPELVAEFTVNATKDQLRVMWRKRMINRFNPMTRGHKATNYPRWLRSDEPYRIKHQRMFEPWIICDRHLVPWYDSRFRGFGKNKIAHLEVVNHTGFIFVVHPSVWTVHRPHDLSVASKVHQENKEMNSSSREPGNLFERNKLLFEEICRDLDAGLKSNEVVDLPSQSCRKLLPWWIQ